MDVDFLISCGICVLIHPPLSIKRISQVLELRAAAQ